MDAPKLVDIIYSAKYLKLHFKTEHYMAGFHEMSKKLKRVSQKEKAKNWAVVVGQAKNVPKLSLIMSFVSCPGAYRLITWKWSNVIICKQLCSSWNTFSYMFKRGFWFSQFLFDRVRLSKSEFIPLGEAGFVSFCFAWDSFCFAWDQKQHIGNINLKKKM